MTGNRSPVLDGVRGTAIVLVLLFHCFPLGSYAFGSPVLTGALDGMWLGVDLFFVLSGYLITSILIREKARATHYFRDFYLRRSLRIFPAYYLALGLIFVVLPLLSAPLRASSLDRDAPYLLLYLQNLLMSSRGDNMAWPGANHFWSLAIEEQFYLFWPLLVMLTPRQWLPWLCVFVFSMAVAAKLHFFGLGSSVWTPYTFTLCRADALVAGAFVSTLPMQDSRSSSRMFSAALVCSLGALALVVIHNHGFGLTRGMVTFATPAVAIIFALLLKAIHQNALSSIARSLLSARWLTWLGRYSYGIYLLHWPIYICALEWCVSKFSRTASEEFFVAMLAVGAACIGVSLALAWGMYHAIEAPSLRYAERFRHPRPAQNPAAAILQASLIEQPVRV